MNKSISKDDQIKLNIAFNPMGGEEWAAGRIYLKNLFHALQQNCSEELHTSLLAPSNRIEQNYLDSIEADEIISYNTPARWTPHWGINVLSKRLFYSDMVLKKVLREHKIDVLFGPMLFYKFPKMATLSWLPDFQHIHLPGMFYQKEINSRNQLFLRCAKLATRIILPTIAAKKDFESFAPNYAHKAVAIHPISYISESIYDYDLKQIQTLYNLPEKFVYLPNQFWKHKNHELVFRTIKILRDEGIEINVVCTGNQVDYRHPMYFSDLLNKLSEWNIKDQIIILGQIPHDHVLLLIRQSVCLINPSFFEGWGMTVDEARTLGKQVLLSDIPAHRSQDPPKAVFFDPYDCDELADKLYQMWIKTAPGPDFELEAKARHDLPLRISAYSEVFFSVASQAYREVNGQLKY